MARSVIRAADDILDCCFPYCCVRIAQNVIKMFVNNVFVYDLALVRRLVSMKQCFEGIFGVGGGGGGATKISMLCPGDRPRIQHKRFRCLP